MSVLSVLAWRKKGSLFTDRNGEWFASIWKITDLVKLNNSGVHSSFARSELYRSTENLSLNCCWKQAEDGSGKILLLFIGCFL